ncbi:MAG TPA: hypothetical protein VGK80_01135 [Rhodanobacteraceae bacterium]
MIDWYFSLPRTTGRQRLWALLLLVACWLDFAHVWSDLHDDLAIVRWIAWMMIAGAVLLTPMCLMVLLCGRAPRWFVSRPGSLSKTLPQIHEGFKREHAERERNSRRF